MDHREITELCEALPPHKRKEVADFARFLLARQNDEQWESLIGDSKPRAKLDAFLRDSADEGEEVLDKMNS